MILLIDGTNIISGGGASHLIELLNATKSSTLKKDKITKIIVIGVLNVTERLPKKDWLQIINIPENKSRLVYRIIWKIFNFNKIIKQESVDFIYNPGGSYFGKKVPYVTMCRNMLVFETKEANRFGLSLQRIKLVLLRILESLSMKRAAGVIFISKYAQNYLKENYPAIEIKQFSIINHGVSNRFKNDANKQKEISDFTINNPYKILYVSILNLYKHHAELAEAIVSLSEEEKFPLEFIVVGQKAGGYKKFEKIRAKHPNIIKYLGKVEFEEIQLQYRAADLFIFGSTCENMPNILIEAMSSGIPIISSDKEPMPEFLGLGGLYFSVEKKDSIYQALKKVIEDVPLRNYLLEKSISLSHQYSWEKCAEETFEFISKCYVKN